MGKITMKNNEEFIYADDFEQSVKAMYPNSYTYKELTEKYNIESDVGLGVLCSSKEDEGTLIIFFKLKSPIQNDNKILYVPATTGM